MHEFSIFKYIPTIRDRETTFIETSLRTGIPMNWLILFPIGRILIRAFDITLEIQKSNFRASTHRTKMTE